MQQKQKEWYEQWSMWNYNELPLFKDWIHPVNIEEFKDKEVLEIGCGKGQHTTFVSPFAKHITAIDLNTAELAKEQNRNLKNVIFLEEDVMKMNLGKKFDFVMAIGVLHHTNSPATAFKNMAKHTKKGGKTIVWVYSKEGNALVRYLVEPLRKLFFRHLNRKILVAISKIITAMMYPFIYTIYKLPLKSLPFYEYFGNFRKLNFNMNSLNVFDKLNAPQVDFISYQRIKMWFLENNYSDITITPYMGVSWRGCGIKN